MAQFRIVSLAIVMAVVICRAFGIVDNFHFVTDGVYDSWKRMDPESVGDKQSYATIYGGEKLWLITRQATSIRGTGMSSNGGIISSFDIARNSTWDHRSFKAVDQSASGDVLFAAGGRLFMLTIDTSANRVQYRKLYVWDDEKHDWIEIPMNVDPQAATRGISDDTIFRLNSADPDGNVIYALSTVSNPAESILSKLDIQFDDASKTPIKANVEFLDRKVHYLGSAPPRIGYAAPVGKNGDLVRLFDYEVMLTGKMYTYDSTTKQISNDTMQVGAVTEQRELDDRMFQDASNLYMIRLQKLEAESKRPSREVKRVNLETMEASNGPTWSFFPDLDPYIKFAYRPDQRLLYAASLVKGVFVANVTDWFVQG